MPRLALLALLVVATPALGATLTGTVSAAVVPAPVLAVVTHDRHICGQRGRVWSSSVAADAAGRLEGAIVYVEARAPSDARALVTASPRRPRPALIDQRDCAFVPAVAAVAVGGELRARSSDPVLHNVHVRRQDGSTAANVSMPLAGTEAVLLVADRPGPLTLSCGAGHTWMHADVLVLEHGLYTATGRGGAYRLEGVPAGAWWLVAWHPRLGERRVAIEVAAGERTQRQALAY